MWGIAHAQGIRLPTKDYWEFRDMITVSPRRARSFDGYLQLFHWTELIQSSPLAVERSVYEVIGGAYRRNNITTIELRFNPMKRNRGGEQDLDHIISAAIRGMDRATLEYPVTPGIILCLDRAFPFHLNEIIVEKAIAYHARGVVGIDIAGPESAAFRPADYKRLFDRARRKGLGITVHTGESGPVEEIGEVIRHLEPSRIGHGVKAAFDPRTMAHDPRAGHHPRGVPHQQPQHARGLRLGRVPLDLRHVPAARRAVHHQHRRPGDAQDLHPGRAVDAWAGWASCRSRSSCCPPSGRARRCFVAGV